MLEGFRAQYHTSGLRVCNTRLHNKLITKTFHKMQKLICRIFDRTPDRTRQLQRTVQHRLLYSAFNRSASVIAEGS